MLHRQLFAAVLFAAFVFLLPACAGEDKKGELLDNEKLIMLIKAEVTLDVILDKIQNSKTDFRHDSADIIAIQNACRDAKEAKWKPDEIAKLHKKVGELALQGQRDLKQLVFIFMGAAENLATVPDRENDPQYEQQRKKIIVAGSAIVPFILDNLLVQESDRKRVALLHALEGIEDKSPRIIKQCMLMLDDKSKPVRAQAASCVRALATGETGDQLIAMFDRREGTKDGVAIALGFLKYEKAIPALVKLLKTSQDADERVSAAFALGEIRAKTPEAQEALLMGIIDERDEKLRVTCAKACKLIGFAATPSYIIRAYNRYRQGRRELLPHLDTIKDITAARFLAEKLGDDDNEIRRVSMDTLERLTHEKFDRAEDWIASIDLLQFRPDWKGQREAGGKLPEVGGEQK